MNKKTIVLLMVLSAFSCISFALADPSAPTNIDIGSSSSRDLSGLADQSVSAQAGNVTQINITALAITQSWQGYYGNVSGTMTLDDGDNNTFYNWTIASAAGEVYATRTSAVDFSTINCSNSTHIAAEETSLGQSATDTDAVSNTFDATLHPSFDVGSVAFTANACPSTNAFGPSGAQTNDYFQVLMQDGSANTVYSTLLNGTQSGFNGQSWDFQLLVGEDGHGNTATTTYFFFVELG